MLSVFYCALFVAIRLAQLTVGVSASIVESRWADVSTPIVDLGYAQYQGTFDQDTNITTFFGIRYAEAPTGALRWQAPQTPTYIASVQQATAQPNQCYQSAIGDSSTDPYSPSSFQKRAVPPQSEDCLFLNVYSPGPLEPAAGLPVLVFIHGGGYLTGDASTYTGQDIIRESGFGVINVIIQYRLGLFGFLPGSEVKANGSLNAGLLDQNFALEWVQKHISSFGGDPSKVVIWGESAGAGSVIQHAVAHGGQTQPPLFRATMTSSTFLPSQYHYNDTIPEMVFSETIAKANCSVSNALECLRSTDISVLQGVNLNISLAGFYGTSVYAPVVDGTFIVERPTITLERRQVNGEMLLAVTNLYEGYTFVNMDNPPTNITTFVAELFPLLDQVNLQAVVEQYTRDTDLTNTTAQAVAILGESTFICPSYLFMSAFGARAYKGEFAIPPAYHADDLAYYFPTAFHPRYNNPALITSFSQSFTSVARFLNPNVKVFPDAKPPWSTWENGTTEMLFNVSATGAPVIHTIATDPGLLERCAFWQGISSSTNQ